MVNRSLRMKFSWALAPSALTMISTAKPYGKAGYATSTVS